MTTTRESYESAGAELKAALAAVETKTPSQLTAEEVRRLEAASARVAATKQLWDSRTPYDDSAQAGFRDLAASGVHAAGPSSEGMGTKTFGKVAAVEFSTDDLEALQKGALDRQMVTKATLATTGAPFSTVPNYAMGVHRFARDQTRILDAIPSERTTAPIIHYFRALAAAAAAAAVAEGANKPESTPTWEQATATVRKLAHYARVNDEVIADFDGFLQVIGGEMIAGLIEEENDQLLNGDGTAPNIRGLLTTVGIQTVGSAGTDLDAVATAANMIRVNAFVEPDTIVMHPNDWASTGFLLAKDTAGKYLLTDALGSLTPRLWGIPVLLTTRMTENTLMVANLREAARVYVRQPPTIEVQPGGGTAEFIANQTLIRAEERLALTVVRPLAICTVTAV